MNSAFCRPINDTPYYINHGRDYNFDFSKVLNNTKINYTADTDYNAEMSQRLATAFKSVAESDSFHKDQYATQYNKNLKIHKITPGSLVLLRNETKENTMGRKFAPRFTGPYRVLNFVSTNKCNIKGVHYNFNRTYLVHTDRLKPCNLLRDPYPKFENLDENSADDKLIINTKVDNVAPEKVNKTKIKQRHTYNLRSGN
jgi:hypothetical protein